MQKYGQSGNMPQTKQAVVANQCPMNCGKESAVLCARPGPGTIATWWSRCQRCLAYWETSPAGQVTALRVVDQVGLCPDCREPMNYPERLVHVCAREVV